MRSDSGTLLRSPDCTVRLVISKVVRMLLIYSLLLTDAFVNIAIYLLEGVLTILMTVNKGHQ